MSHLSFRSQCVFTLENLLCNADLRSQLHSWKHYKVAQQVNLRNLFKKLYVLGSKRNTMLTWAAVKYILYVSKQLLFCLCLFSASLVLIMKQRHLCGVMPPLQLKSQSVERTFCFLFKTHDIIWVREWWDFYAGESLEVRKSNRFSLSGFQITMHLFSHIIRKKWGQ